MFNLAIMEMREIFMHRVFILHVCAHFLFYVTAYHIVIFPSGKLQSLTRMLDRSINVNTRVK